MAYEEAAADRIRDALASVRGVNEIEMFGGLCFTVDGHMTVALSGNDLLVRVGPEQWEAALARPHAREMDFTGRSMKGYVAVAWAGLKTKEALESWVTLAVAFVRGLPAKKPKPRRTR